MVNPIFVYNSVLWAVWSDTDAGCGFKCNALICTMIIFFSFFFIFWFLYFLLFHFSLEISKHFILNYGHRTVLNTTDYINKKKKKWGKQQPMVENCICEAQWRKYTGEENVNDNRKLKMQWWKCRWLHFTSID